MDDENNEAHQIWKQILFVFLRRNQRTENILYCGLFLEFIPFANNLIFILFQLFFSFSTNFLLFLFSSSSLFSSLSCSTTFLSLIFYFSLIFSLLSPTTLRQLIFWVFLLLCWLKKKVLADFSTNCFSKCSTYWTSHLLMEASVLLWLESDTWTNWRITSSGFLVLSHKGWIVEVEALILILNNTFTISIPPHNWQWRTWLVWASVPSNCWSFWENWNM